MSMGKDSWSGESPPSGAIEDADDDDDDDDGAAKRELGLGGGRREVVRDSKFFHNARVPWALAFCR